MMRKTRVSPKKSSIPRVSRKIHIKPSAKVNVVPTPVQTQVENKVEDKPLVQDKPIKKKMNLRQHMNGQNGVCPSLDIDQNCGLPAGLNYTVQVVRQFTFIAGEEDVIVARRLATECPVDFSGSSPVIDEDAVNTVAIVYIRLSEDQILVKLVPNDPSFAPNPAPGDIIEQSDELLADARVAISSVCLKFYETEVLIVRPQENAVGALTELLERLHDNVRINSLYFAEANDAIVIEVRAEDLQFARRILETRRDQLRLIPCYVCPEFTTQRCETCIFPALGCQPPLPCELANCAAEEQKKKKKKRQDGTDESCPCKQNLSCGCKHKGKHQ